MPHRRRTALAATTAAALFAAAPAHADTAAGRVVGPDGKPVAGAFVAASAATPQGMEDLEVVTTGPDGVFRIDDGGRTGRRPDGEPGALRVSVFAPGYALAQQQVPLGAAPADLKLTPSVPLKGAVVGGDGKPLVGVAVRLGTVFFGDPREGRWLQVPQSLAERMSVKTGADGSYSVPGAPAEGRASVVLDDERFARAVGSATLSPTGATAASLKASPAALLAGRVVYEDGKPAAGVNVFVQAQGDGRGSGSAVTDAEGRYRIGALPAGRYNVMVNAYRSGKDLVAAAAEGVGAEAAATAPVPDLRLTEGALIVGRITDAETGAPVAGAQVGNYGPHRPRSSAAVFFATADAEGRYRLRVAPGDNYVYFYSAPEDYLREGSGATFTVKPGETADRPLTLKKGLALSGVVVGADGQPAAGASFQLRSDYDEKVVVADQEGNWRAGGLRPDKPVRFTTRDGSMSVVEPAGEVRLPAAGPITVKLAKAEVAALSGRVVDTAGAPVAGVSVKARLANPKVGDTWSVDEKQVTTDTDGRFSVPVVRSDQTVTFAATRAGYRFLRGGEVRREGAAVTASDMVLTPLDRRFSGSVVDAKGKPVAGVTVLASDGGPGAQAVTDAKGRFALSDLPRGSALTLIAGGKPGWTRTDVRADDPGPAVLTLDGAPTAGAPKPSVPAARALLEYVGQNAPANYYAKSSLASALAPYAPDAALEMLREKDGRTPDSAVVRVLYGLMETDPAKAADWGQPRLASLTDARQRRRAAQVVAYSLVRAGRAVEAAALYRSLSDEAARQPAGGGGGDWDALYDTLNRAMLAAALRTGEADALAAQAVEIGKRLRGEQSFAEEGTGAMIAEVLAEGDPALGQRIALSLPEKARPSALRQAAVRVARVSPLAARGLLAAMKGGEGETSFDYGVAAKAVTEALALQDPAAALALARTITRDESAAEALALAAGAQKDPKVREAAFREAFAAATRANGGGDLGLAARVSALAFDADPVLGRALFAEARKMLPVASADAGEFPDPRRSGRGIAAFAFFYARVSPTESRLLLEKEMLRRQREFSGERESGAGIDVALAMVAADADRAIEIARTLVPAGNARWDAQRKIAQYLVAPESVRRTMPFDRWNASDTWTPGTQTGW